MSSMIIFDVNYDDICRSFCKCDVYLSLDSSVTDTPKRKPTVQIQQKVKRLKVQLIGGVYFDKNMSNKDSSFVPSDEKKDEWGVSICY